MATASLNTIALAAAPGRLRSIAYNSIGIQTEGGAAPYTRVVNAGGASGLGLGVFQNDFKQRSDQAGPYAKAVFEWIATSNRALSFTEAQFEQALKSSSLTAEMQTAAQSFGGTSFGAGWIHDKLDIPHLNFAVSAAERALATPYGQAVLAQGEHVEEFAAFAMKVFNQYGPGTEGGNGQIKSPAFGALMDYLKDSSVAIMDNSPGHAGQIKTIEAQNPDIYDLSDLKGFADTYSQTRAIVNPAVADGPMRALASGGLYKAILASDSSLSDALLRTEAKGDFSPAQIGSDPDVAITRAVFGTSTSTMKNAVNRINDSTSIDPISVSVTLGQYLDTIWIDPLTEKVAITYKATGSGWLLDKDKHLAFEGSQVNKVDGVKTLVVEPKEGDTGIAFDKAPFPLPKSSLTSEAATTLPIGHWEEQPTYTDLGVPLGTHRVWVPSPAVATTAPSNSSSFDTSSNQVGTTFKVADLKTPTLARHFAGGGATGSYGAGQLGGFDVLPLNDKSSFLVNADGDIAGEINQLGNGYVQIKDLGGNVAYVNEQTGQALSSDGYDKAKRAAQAAQAGSALGLMQSIIGLQNWEQMSELQRVAAVTSIYNVVDKLAGGQLPGELGGAAAVLGLLNALAKGYSGHVAISGLSLVETLTQTVSAAGRVTQVGWLTDTLSGKFLLALGRVHRPRDFEISNRTFVTIAALHIRATPRVSAVVRALPSLQIHRFYRVPKSLHRCTRLNEQHHRFVALSCGALQIFEGGRCEI